MPFLIISRTMPLSQTLTELLYQWSRSTRGIETYQYLLQYNQTTLTLDSLMFGVSALVEFHNLGRETEACDSNTPKPVKLIDIHNLLTGRSDPAANQAILEDMVWSLFALTSPAHACRAYHPFIIRTIGTRTRKPDRLLYRYWASRLDTGSNHESAMTEVWKHSQVEKRDRKLLSWWPKLRKTSTSCKATSRVKSD